MRRDDRFHQQIIKIRAILVIFWPFEDFYWLGQPVFFGAYISDPALDYFGKKNANAGRSLTYFKLFGMIGMMGTIWHDTMPNGFCMWHWHDR